MLDFVYNQAASGGVTSTPRKPNHNSRQRAFMANDQVSANWAEAQPVTEIWRPVPSEPGVLASSEGRILLRPGYAPTPNGGYRTYLPIPRVGCVTRSNKGAAHSYYNIALPGLRTRKTHQLVCEAFHGPKPFPRAIVIHLDENGLNNRPENLKWGTQKENLNMPRFLEYCRARTGEDNPNVKGKKRKQGI